MQYKINVVSYNNSTQTVEEYIVDKATFLTIVQEHDKFYKFKTNSSLQIFKDIHGYNGSLTFQFPDSVNLIKKVLFHKPVDDIINNL